MVEYEITEQNLTESNTFSKIRGSSGFVTCRPSGAMVIHWYIEVLGFTVLVQPNLRVVKCQHAVVNFSYQQFRLSKEKDL